MDTGDYRPSNTLERVSMVSVYILGTVISLVYQLTQGTLSLYDYFGLIMMFYVHIQMLLLLLSFGDVFKHPYSVLATAISLCLVAMMLFSTNHLELKNLQDYPIMDFTIYWFIPLTSHTVSKSKAATRKVREIVAVLTFQAPGSECTQRLGTSRQADSRMLVLLSVCGRFLR